MVKCLLFYRLKWGNHLNLGYPNQFFVMLFLFPNDLVDQVIVIHSQENVVLGDFEIEIYSSDVEAAAFLIYLKISLSGAKESSMALESR